MNLEEMGKFKDISLLILISLAEEDKHGYAIMEDLKNNFSIELGAGTLYGAISRLEKNNLIKPVITEDRKIPYKITEEGKRLLSFQLEHINKIISTGKSRLRLT